MVVEEGVYIVGADGVKMEAAKYTSTVTDRKGSWNGQSQSYSNTYSSPVVVGQVMTAADADWSVFWARGGSRTAPPNSSNLYCGRKPSKPAMPHRKWRTHEKDSNKR